MNYKRILLKLSGESLMGEVANIDKSKTKEIALLIKRVREMGVEVGIVIGGGNFFRGRSNQDMNPQYVDTMGMLGTVSNALGLADAFEKEGVSFIVSTPFNLNNLIPLYTEEEVLEKIKDNVVLFGGGTGHIGCSTDTAASNKASLIKADTIIKLTNVDGVYDKDPNKYPDAVMYENLTHQEVLDNPEIKVMDLGAIEECMNNNIDINVINFNDKENLFKVLRGEKIGTRISSHE
jgi:uridylate kinase